MLRWTVNKQNGGKERAGQAVVAVGHKVYSFTDSMDQIGVHVFDTVALRWQKLPPVKGGKCLNRYSHTAVLVEDTIYIWGGVTTWKIHKSREYCDELYAFDVDTHRWFKPEISGTVPKGRYNHSACVLGKVMFIYGSTQLTGHINDIYKLDTTTMVWSLIKTRGTPPPASESCYIANIIGTKMFLFGGNGGRYIRVFDTETNSWLSTSSRKLLTESHFFHSAFAYNGELYTFGFWNHGLGLQYFNDLWKFNPDALLFKKLEPKGKGLCSRTFYRICYCMVGDRLFIFGGYRSGGGSTPTLADDLNILDLNPSLKTLCKLAVIQYGLERSGLPHNIRWELAAMTTNNT